MWILLGCAVVCLVVALVLVVRKPKKPRYQTYEEFFRAWDRGEPDHS